MYSLEECVLSFIAQHGHWKRKKPFRGWPPNVLPLKNSFSPHSFTWLHTVLERGGMAGDGLTTLSSGLQYCSLIPTANTCSMLKKVGFYPCPKLTTSKSSNYYKPGNYLMKGFSLGDTTPIVSLKMPVHHRISPRPWALQALVKCSLNNHKKYPPLQKLKPKVAISAYKKEAWYIIPLLLSASAVARRKQILLRCCTGTCVDLMAFPCDRRYSDVPQRAASLLWGCTESCSACKKICAHFFLPGTVELWSLVSDASLLTYLCWNLETSTEVWFQVCLLS